MAVISGNAAAQTVAGGDLTTPAPATWPTLVLRALFPLIPVVGLLYGIIRILAGRDGDHTGRAVALSSAVLVAVFLLLEMARPGEEQAASAKGSRYGWTTVLFGVDGRMSTSKTQVFLWTIGVAYAALFLAGVAVFVQPHRTIFTDTNWEDYLVLLGGPFAAAVLAKYTVSSKVNSGVLAKAPTDNANSATPGDLISQDDGSLDLVDTQYFIFNVVAFTYAAAVFISQNFNHSVLIADGKYTFPKIPAVLLALTSAAAATYVGNKTVQKNGPSITGVTPDKNVHTNDLISVKGVNLVPPGTPASVASAQTTVWISSADTSVQKGPSVATATLVQFTMPPSFEGKTVNVVVVSSGAIPTQEYPITVAQ